MSGHSRERNKHKGRSTENFFMINCMHRNEPSMLPFGPFFGPLALRALKKNKIPKIKQDYSFIRQRENNFGNFA